MLWHTASGMVHNASSTEKRVAFLDCGDGDPAPVIIPQTIELYTLSKYSVWIISQPSCQMKGSRMENLKELRSKEK